MQGMMRSVKCTLLKSNKRMNETHCTAVLALNYHLLVLVSLSFHPVSAYHPMKCDVTKQTGESECADGKLPVLVIVMEHIINLSVAVLRLLLADSRSTIQAQ